jgi:prepilin-type N-terminal cleavage/methylation domain-containing protein
MNDPRFGFTLVELLVVVTIIVLLLALLAPALDRAIYQAELAVCGSQMRSLSGASLLYAMGQRRAYPGRDERSSDSAMEIKQRVNAPGLATGTGGTFNVPGLLESYIGVRAWVDPFLQGAGLRIEEAMQDPDAVLMPGYHYYPDWGTANNFITRMTRMGQKLIFDAPEGDTRRFGIIVADRDARMNENAGNNSHPDKASVQHLWGYQEGGNPWLGMGDAAPFAGPTTGNVYVAWWRGARARTGLLDNHYALDDGSILRLNDVPIVRVFSPQDDPRITFLPDVSSFGIDSYNGGRRVQLPRAP